MIEKVDNVSPGTDLRYLVLLFANTVADQSAGPTPTPKPESAQNAEPGRAIHAFLSAQTSR